MPTIINVSCLFFVFSFFAALGSEGHKFGFLVGSCIFFAMVVLGYYMIKYLRPEDFQNVDREHRKRNGD
jgi:Ca2+/Na+ antiporter